MTSALGRRLWILVGGALVLTALLVFLSGRGSTARVAVADVLRENLSSVVSTNGKVEPVKPVSFRARYPTIVERVYAVEGQQVKRGQMLFALDDTEVQADLAQARADLATQEELLNVAKAGDLLAELADLRRVRIRAFIDEPELGQIDVNQSVEILWDAHPDRIWNGRTEVLPKQVVTRGTRSVGELICSVTNDRLDLLPNTTVDVRIHVSERPGALVVPRGAVSIEGNKRFVFRVEDNRLHRRLIKVGIANPTKIEVLSGLSDGDVVALPGDASLKENLRIRAVRPE